MSALPKCPNCHARVSVLGQCVCKYCKTSFFPPSNAQPFTFRLGYIRHRSRYAGVYEFGSPYR
jgi:hypothetical protein